MEGFPHRNDRERSEGPIPFPVDLARRTSEMPGDDSLRIAGLPESTNDVLGALDTMSRRIDDLARDLRVLGYFDDDDDGPRAA